MEIVHRIGFNKTDQMDEVLKRLDIQFKTSPLPAGSYVITFDIRESDPRWGELSKLFHDRKPFDMFETVFSNDEIMEAQWLRLKPIFERGYPQPENTWKERTYEHLCSACGLAYGQKVPYRLKKEPHMGKNNFLSLYWAYTLFCTSRVLDRFRTSGLRGFDTWVPLVGRDKAPSQVVTQLLFPLTSKPGLAEDDKQQPEICSACGLTKYRYHNRGYMHYQEEALQNQTDFQLTHEWFGSGRHGGFREMLISNQVAHLILEQGWKGVHLKPLKLI